MILNYNKLKKFCTFITESIQFDGKCKTIYNITQDKDNWPKNLAELKYNSEFDCWYPVCTNNQTFSFMVKGSKLTSPNVGNFNRFALGLEGLSQDGETCYIVFNKKTLLPLIFNQPKNIQEMQELISIEPRYIAQITPGLSKKDRQILLNTACKALEQILDSQATESNNSPYFTEELNQRIAFSNLCLTAINSYKLQCNEYDNIYRRNKEPGEE